MTAASTLTVTTVPAFIQGRPTLAERVDTTDLLVTEIGDGNLNQVFLCRDGSGATLILKQALPYVRIGGPAWPMTAERATREAAAIAAHSAASEMVCHVLYFDREQHVLALEDLSDHTVFRQHLNQGLPHDGIAERLGRHVADTAFATSFVSVGEEAFRQAAAAGANPELCTLTEDVVFTDPFVGAERNSVRLPAVQEQVDGLQADDNWVTAAMAMKLRFVTVAEALIHGDLHSGSVFVRRDDDGLSVKTFDPEFAFYGPIGFDLGLLWANLLAAGVRAHVLGEVDRGTSLFAAAGSSWAAFEQRMRGLWAHRPRREKYPDTFLELWLTSIRIDAFGFAGCEAARRIIGIAKITDVESLPDEEYRRAAGAVLELSRLLLVNRSDLDHRTLCEAAVRTVQPS